MTVAQLLDLAQRRGLQVVIGADGQPKLRGPSEAATPVLLRYLTLRRDEIREHLCPALQRIVQLTGDRPDGAMEVVLWRSADGAGVLSQLEALAREHPGKMLAVERRDLVRGWVRYLWTIPGEKANGRSGTSAVAGPGDCPGQPPVDGPAAGRGETS